MTGPLGTLPVHAQDSTDLEKLNELLNEEKFDELLVYVEEILEKNPNNEIALEFKTAALWELDRYTDAIIFADETLKINPQNDKALHIKSKSLYKLDKYEEALLYIDKAIKVNSDNYRYHTRKGFILDSLGNYEDAVKSYERSLALNPTSKSALENMGESLLELKRYEEAVSFFNKVLEIDPEDSDTLENILFALSNMSSITIPLSDFKVYQIDEIGLKFKMPPNYNLQTSADFLEADISFLSSDMAAFFTIGHEYPLAVIPIENYEEPFVEILSEEFGEIHKLESETILISEKPALKLVATFGEDKDSFKVMTIVTLNKGMMYEIVFVTLEDLYDLHVENVMKAIQTINIEPKEIQFIEYNDPEHNITLEYPVNWFLYEVPAVEKFHNIGFHSPFKSLEDVFPANIVLTVSLDDVTKGMTIESIDKSSFEKGYSAEVKNFKIIESNPTTLHGISSYKFVFTGTIVNPFLDPDFLPIFGDHPVVDLLNLTMSDEIEAKVMQILFIKNDKFHIITYRASPDDFDSYLPDALKTIDSFQGGEISAQPKAKIPDWIKNNAKWWVDGTIDDKAFVGGIQFLIKEGLIQIPETAQSTTSDGSQEIPAWIKNNADWWPQGLISDGDFIKGIQFMVENGIIAV